MLKVQFLMHVRFSSAGHGLSATRTLEYAAFFRYGTEYLLFTWSSVVRESRTEKEASRSARTWQKFRLRISGGWAGLKCKRLT